MTTTEADTLLRSGDLDGARRVLVEAARREPGDAPTRLFLFQLLALAGEWDKARAQLGTLAQLSPEAQMLSVVYGQAIEAEREREAVFAGDARAAIHGDAPWAQGIAETLHMAGGAGDAVAREAAFDAAPDTPGVLNGTPFEWIADADARFGPTIEAIIGGRYGLLPFDQISLMESEGPRDLRDLVWYPCEVTLRSGARIAALLPARYPGQASDAHERLARATGWGDDGRGSGQHLWVTSDDAEQGLLSLRVLRFD